MPTIVSAQGTRSARDARTSRSSVDARVAEVWDSQGFAEVPPSGKGGRTAVFETGPSWLCRRVNDRPPGTDCWSDLVRVIAHPLLDEPELAASAADRVLPGRVKHADVVATRDQLLGEPASQRPLVVIRRRHALVALADHANRGAPDPRIEEDAKPVGIVIRGVAVVSAVIEERTPSDGLMPELASQRDPYQTELGLKRDQEVPRFVRRLMN